MSAWLFTALIGAVAAERVAELLVAQRNLAWSRERNGQESGLAHYPAMVLLHVGLLAGCVTEVWLADRPFIAALGVPMLSLVLAAQALRWWCIRTLGHQWNTRIIVVPGLPHIDRGPYRLLSHPNYLAVVVEGFALPMVHDAWLTATVFTALNTILLAIRIPAENRALANA